MSVRILHDKDRSRFNDLSFHPLQTWEWGEFRKKMGLELIRIGVEKDKKLTQAFQLTLHPVPHLPYRIGYIPKGPAITPEMIEALLNICTPRNVTFVQIEPHVVSDPHTPFNYHGFPGLVPSAKPLFTKYTFTINLTLSEEELMHNMASKTRYNIRLAQRKGVTVTEDNSEDAFETYLALTRETTKRQQFFAHTEKYHRFMWETLSPSGIAHLMTARYQREILAVWVLFLYKGVLYYPYGASTSRHKEVMASNLMMWETIRWGKVKGATLFDLWGTPGPNPGPNDSYYGFHRFKQGFGPNFVEFVGSYDFILKNPHYRIFSLVNTLRWFLLKGKTR